MNDRSPLEVMRDAVEDLIDEVDALVAECPPHEQYAARRQLENKAFDDFIIGAYQALVQSRRTPTTTPRNLI